MVTIEGAHDPTWANNKVIITNGFIKHYRKLCSLILVWDFKQIVSTLNVGCHIILGSTRKTQGIF
jgi:hypothetical protein